MIKHTLTLAFLAFFLSGMAQFRTMIIYKNGIPVFRSLVSDKDSVAFSVSDTVRDIEGNVYRTIRIGNKIWMIDNLRTTRLNDGTPIAQVTTANMKFENGSSGALRKSAAFCWHNNLEYNKSQLGALYNWNAVGSFKLAPAGWRISTKEDWQELEAYLASNGFNYDSTKTTDGSVAKILKSMVSPFRWESNTTVGAVGNNTVINNRSGLNLTSSAYRDGLSWGTVGVHAGYWTYSAYDSLYASSRTFTNADAGINQTKKDYKYLAFSVRCVRDVTATPTSGMLSDVVLTNLKNSYATRRDAGLEALRSAALVVAPLDYTYQTSTGCPLSREFSYSLTNFAFKSLWLNANVDKANAALVQNADFYLANPTYLRDRDSFYWSADEWLRLLELFGRSGTKTAGLITPATETKLYDLMLLYLNTYKPYAYPEYVNSNTWDVDGSENHHAMQFCTFWHFSKLLMNHPDYAARLTNEGVTPAQIYAVTTPYIKRWIVERAKKGLFVEMANDDYNSETLKGFYNLYDFSPDAELKELSGKLLDLYWATWAQEEIDGVRGGGKSRIYRGNQSNGYDGSAGKPFFSKMAYYYLGIGTAYAVSDAVFTAVTSNYRLPLVVMDMAISKSEMGDYELKERPLGLTVTGLYNGAGGAYKLRQDYGGIVRYSYCTPDFIMGTTHVEPRLYTDWTMISSQNRWQGVIFKGDPYCRIYPQAQTDYRAYNQHWTVQSKGCMITQQLPELTSNTFSKYTDTMRVYFSPQGLSGRLERGGWVFHQTSSAYAAVKCVSGTYHWDTPNGRWLVCDDRYAPVIIEVGQKADFTSFTAFQDKILALSLTYDGKVVKHKTLYNEDLEFYTDRTSLPKINGSLLEMRPSYAFESPFIKSMWNSGVVEISKNKRKLVLDFSLK